MTDPLVTARLVLRRPEPNDLEPLAAMNADPEVMRYIGDGSLRTREQTAAGLARAIGGWAENGYGLFALDLRATGRFVGWVTLAEPAFLPEVLPAVEIGWRLARPAWGHGYATEAARVVLRYGFETVGLDRVVSIRHVDNDASRRVMDKLGLRVERSTVVPGTGQPVVVQALDRREWRADKSRRPGL
jgi:RimJ/RimL family protein N-acetyltransferase